METSMTLLQKKAEESLIGYIQAKGLMPGDRLGTTSEMAKEFGVSSGTLHKVLQQLADRGILNRTCKSGTYLSTDYDSILNGHKVDQSKIKSVVLVVPDIRLATFACLSVGVQQFANQADVDVLTISTDNKLENYVDALERYMNRKNTGFIIIPPLANKIPLELVYEMHKLRIPIVTCYRRIEGAGWPIIYSDDIGASKLIAKHICDCGCKNIGYIASKRPSLFHKALHHNFIEQIISMGRAYNPQWTLFLPWLSSYEEIVSGQWHIKQEKEISQWLRSYAKDLDGICCASDELAIIVIKELNAMGINVPNDIAVIGEGHLITRNILSGEITSVSVDYQEMGQEAFRVLNMIADGNELEQEFEVYVRQRIIEGKSTPKIPR